MKKDYYDKMIEIVMAFHKEKDYFELLNVVLNKMMYLTNSDGGTLYVVENDELHFRIMCNNTLNTFLNAHDKIDLPPVKIDKENIENVCAYAAINKEIVCIDDVYDSDKFNFNGPRDYDALTNYRTKSMLVLPLTAGHAEDLEVIGVIQLINAMDENTGDVIPYEEKFDIPVLHALSNIAANVLANILYVTEINDLFNSFVKVMTKTIDERTPYNACHTNNVAFYCESFAKYLSEKFGPGHHYYFSEYRRNQLVMAAFLHDVGKIITPLSVMDKPDRLAGQVEVLKYKIELKKMQIKADQLQGYLTQDAYEQEIQKLTDAWVLIQEANIIPVMTDEMVDKIKSLEQLTYVDTNGEVTSLLTPENRESLKIVRGTLTAKERAIMQNHVSLTSSLLDKIKFNRYYKEVPHIAGNHHEFLDGTGYPRGLKGNQISIEARILAMMDIFDALTARDRPYKKPVPFDSALNTLKKMAVAGKLDADLVDLFIESNVW